MSMLVRANPLRLAARNPALRQQVRQVHIENVVDHTIPGNVTRKFGLAAKMAVYVTLSFGLPFYAAHFQIKKAAAA